MNGAARDSSNMTLFFLPGIVLFLTGSVRTSNLD